MNQLHRKVSPSPGKDSYERRDQKNDTGDFEPKRTYDTTVPAAKARKDEPAREHHGRYADREHYAGHEQNPRARLRSAKGRDSDLYPHPAEEQS